jgi:OFA family oxalate/formate antiporter-like MFS transporter
MNEKVPKGWLVVLGAILLQLSVGSIYSWSLFNEPFTSKFNLQENKVVLTFSITVFTFAFVTIFSGKLQDRIGPRLVASIGGIFYGVGLFLTSTASSIIQLYIYYGIIVAIGVGFVYVCPLSTCIKWFPNKKGFITGIVVGAFGLGSLVFKAITEQLLASQGISKTFLYLGIIHTILILIGAQFLTLPPDTATINSNKAVNEKLIINFTVPEMIKTKSFYLLWIIYLLGCISGLLVIGVATDIGVNLAGLEHSVAANAVASIALFNAGGRLIWGAFSDKLGRIKVVFILLVITSICMTALSVVNLSLVTFFITVSGIAFCFGGFLSVFPAITGEFFGLKNLGANYGIIYQAYGLSALAGPLIELLAGGLKPAFIICAVLSAVGAGLTFMVKEPLYNT